MVLIMELAKFNSYQFPCLMTRVRIKQMTFIKNKNILKKTKPIDSWFL